MLLLLFSFSLPFLSEEFLPQSMGSTLLFVFFFFQFFSTSNWEEGMSKQLFLG